MFVAGNRQINFVHITMIEWIEEPISVKDPTTNANVKMYGFKVHTSYNHIEQMLYKNELKRQEAWEELIDSMVAAGY